MVTGTEKWECGQGSGAMGPVGSCFKFPAIIAYFTLMGENVKKGKRNVGAGVKFWVHTEKWLKIAKMNDALHGTWKPDLWKEYGQSVRRNAEKRAVPDTIN